MKWSNVVHNILNVLLVIIPSLMAYDWSAFEAFGLTPEMTNAGIAALGVIKLSMNAVRDGLAGMIAVQPPVEKP